MPIDAQIIVNYFYQRMPREEYKARYSQGILSGTGG
jgi:hypothetical protein